MVTIVTNVAIGASISLIFGFINSLQMIMYLALSQAIFPPVVLLLYQIMLPLATLDVIPPEISTDWIFYFSENDYPYSEKLEYLGFDSHNMIYNLGSLYYFILLNVFATIISVILRFCKSNKKAIVYLKEKL